MLGQTIQWLRGTPYIYQGEEIGMTDPNYQAIAQYDDIETHNNYRIMLEKGYSVEKALDIIRSKSRDNSRTPMQWDDSLNAGFSTGTPWLEVAANYPQVNVQSALQAERSIFAYYQQLIQLRKQYDVISEGTYRGLLLDHPSVMAYVREYKGQQLLVLSHFYADQAEVVLPVEFQGRPATYLLGNGATRTISDVLTLSDYETVAFLFETH